MSGRSYAVLLGNGTFGDDQPQLRTLRCPAHDVAGLAEVLASEEHGGYLVTTMVDGTHDSARRAVYQCLKKAASEDLVLVYFSGHGKLDEDGNLYLATKDTVVDVLPPTSFPVDDIRKYLAESAASRKVVILDCCFSGAIKKMYKGEIADQASQAIRDLEGQGTFYLTASTDIQLAEEKEGDEYSLLTKHILGAIKGGKADSNDDGRVSFQELCLYVQAQVPKEGAQKPKAWFLEAEGDVTLALTGKPASDARRKAVTRKLYELANQGVLTDDVVTDLLQLIKQDPASRFTSDLAVRGLIDSLYSKLGSVGAFVQEAVRCADHPKQASIPSVPPDVSRTTEGDDVLFKSDPDARRHVTWLELLSRWKNLLLIGTAIFLSLALVLGPRFATPRGASSTQRTQTLSPEMRSAAVSDPSKISTPSRIDHSPAARPPGEEEHKSSQGVAASQGGSRGLLKNRPPSARASDEAEHRSPQRVPVSQIVSQGLLISKTNPAYPPLARQARIQGSVVLQAEISRDGKVEDLQLISGHPMLVSAAVEAVKQWRYKPYVLDGEPVAVETQIIVTFTLSGG